LGLQIPVNDALAVGFAERPRDLDGDVERALRGHRRSLFDLFVEGAAVQILHRHEDVAVFGLTVVVDGDDVGMGQPRAGRSFEEEPPQELLTRALDLGAYDLDRHRSSQRHLGRQIDPAHSARGDDPLHGVAVGEHAADPWVFAGLERTRPAAGEGRSEGRWRWRVEGVWFAVDQVGGHRAELRAQLRDLAGLRRVLGGVLG
jgi:hypothetical protein